MFKLVLTYLFTYNISLPRVYVLRRIVTIVCRFSNSYNNRILCFHVCKVVIHLFYLLLSAEIQSKLQFCTKFRKC